MKGLLSVPLLAILLAGGRAEAGETPLVERFVEAFNARDLDAMLSMTHEDVRWMSVSATDLVVEISNRDQLRAWIAKYFESTPSAHSMLRSVHDDGRFVHAVEAASWESDGIEKSQCSVSVYEIEGDKIRNVWYFPAYACPSETTGPST